MRADPRQVVEAQVWKAGRWVAWLRRRPEGVLFGYVDDYEGPAVATTLPVGPTRASPGGALPAYFTGLLPEGRRLGALRRSVKTSADDELSLLLAVGEDTVGDVQVVRPGWSPEDKAPRVQVGGVGLNFRSLLRELDIHPDRVGLPGIQDKASALMISLPVERAGERHLLKLSPPQFPHLVENEAFFLRAGRTTGLAMAHATVVRDVEEVPGLLVRRFDRTTAPSGQARPLAVEDGCQVLDRPPGDKYLVGYPESFRALAAVCDARLLAARTLVAQLAFAYVTGDGDAHAKNFSVLQMPDGEWQVSPGYDAPCTYLYGDVTTAMSVNGREADLGRQDFDALGHELGLPTKATDRALRQVTDGVDSWLGRLDELPFDDRRLHKLRRTVRQRTRRLRST